MRNWDALILLVQNYSNALPGLCKPRTHLPLTLIVPFASIPLLRAHPRLRFLKEQEMGVSMFVFVAPGSGRCRRL